jgi:hypothetical protein
MLLLRTRLPTKELQRTIPKANEDTDSNVVRGNTLDIRVP